MGGEGRGGNKTCVKQKGRATARRFARGECSVLRPDTQTHPLSKVSRLPLKDANSLLSLLKLGHKAVHVLVTGGRSLGEGRTHTHTHTCPQSNWEAKVAQLKKWAVNHVRGSTSMNSR